MTIIEGTLFCDRCGAEITWAPYLVQPAPGDPPQTRIGEYCCQDCAEGRPCHCADRMELDDDRRSSAGPTGLAGY